ncbi:helix-turn-helix transcriptional regulator [bacterium]|nr:helix-turn-helix transcriptional regulator [bacterium]
MKNKVNTPEAIEKILPEKLKIFRKISGLTTAQVGKALNKTASAVTLWETGKALPDVNILLKLCDIYKVADLNDFLETSMPPDIKSLARSEQELIKLWRQSSNSVKTAIKTILKQCNK